MKLVMCGRTVFSRLKVHFKIETMCNQFTVEDIKFTLDTWLMDGQLVTDDPELVAALQDIKQ